MGKFSAMGRQWYWLSRALMTMPEPPAKETPFNELTDEQKAARYMHRAYYILYGEKFDKKAFDDMINPYKVQNNNKK